MTEFARYLVSILDNNRIPDPAALAVARYVVALGAERIDRDEFTSIISMGMDDSEICIAFAEWSREFEFVKCQSIDKAWSIYTSEWTSDCIIATKQVSIIQPGSDGYFIVVCTAEIAHTHKKKFKAMNSRFIQWSADESHSKQFIAEMAVLREKYDPFLA